MKRKVCLALALAAFAFVGSFWVANAGPPADVSKEDCFYLKSLHYTARGMGYWYSKENGGLETVTGIPYSKLGCKNCHVGGCDRCHRTERGKRMAYTIKASQKQNMCLKCHGREKAMIMINFKQKQEDVHVVKGMQCVDCHSQRGPLAPAARWTKSPQSSSQLQDLSPPASSTASPICTSSRWACSSRISIRLSPPPAVWI